MISFQRAVQQEKQLNAGGWILDSKEWKYKISGDKTAAILMALMSALFGSMTLWLHKTNNGAFIFTGLITVVLQAARTEHITSILSLPMSEAEPGSFPLKRLFMNMKSMC